MVAVILELVGKLASLAIEAAASAHDASEDINAKFKAALLDAAGKAGLDFSASDAAFEAKLK